MMVRVIYWIREYITNRKSCRGFCPTCRFYRQCREDEEEGIDKGNDRLSGDTGTGKSGIQIYDAGDYREAGAHRFVSIGREKTMESKRIESEDHLKVEQILIEEEARRAAFLRELFRNGEAA